MDERARKAVGGGAILRCALVLGLVMVASLALLSSSASAAYDHSVVEKEFSVGSECSSPYESRINSIAVDEVHGWVYVGCNHRVRRFTLSGAPAPFSAVEPYIHGNELTYDPDGEETLFANRTNLAVDNSNSINRGRLFVTSSPNLDIFEPSGEYFTNVTQPLESSISNYLESLAVGPDGSIYLGSQSPGGRVSKYNPQLHEVKRLYTSTSGEPGPCNVAVDSTGAIWLDRCFTFFDSERRLSKYDADQFSNELALTPLGGSSPAQIEPYVGTPSPFTPEPPLTEIGQVGVDLNTDEVYVDRGKRIEVYSPGTAEERSYQVIPAFPTTGLKESFALAVTADHHVYVSKGGEKIIIFGPGNILPDLHTHQAAVDDIGHTSARVTGTVERSGGTKIVSCYFQYGPKANYEGPGSGTAPCVPSSFEDASREVEATLPLAVTGQTYHYRIAATNEKGTNFGADRTVVPAFVLKLHTLPVSELGAGGAQLNGSFDPDGIATEYFFEYGINTGYGFKTPISNVPPVSGVQEVGSLVGGLPAGKTFHYRIVAKNANGTTVGDDQSFRTGSAPDIFGARSTEVGESSATLHARIDPVGFETHYQIEYGTTSAYGSSMPAAPVGIGAGTEPVDVEQVLTGLQSGFTYHFRVVAENKWGKSQSPDTTFNYAPPTCPNDHLRQQAGASYLPDCRAYELVSPDEAGAILLSPSEQIAALSGEGLENTNNNNTYNRGVNYIVNRGFAESPSRFSFYGGVGTINGIYAPISEADMYMSTRTATGWETTLPGLDGHLAYETGRKECSEAMDLCVDHSESEYYGFHLESAPYLYTAEGKSLGRLPTNLDVIPNGADFRGWQRMSGDFKHFVFSSSAPGEGYSEGSGVSVSFAPGGLTSGVGSAYDNDIAARTVKLISRLPDGSDIPTKVAPKTNPAIAFPGVSPDGSRILMSTYGGGPNLRYLYMSVNDAAVMEIGLKETGPTPEQVPVEPIGMTRDGSKVIFATTEKMLPADTDSSRDIYTWSEATQKLTLDTQGNGQGNSDECSATWTSGCNAQVVTPERAHPNNNEATGVPTAEDDQFAEEAGDVFFYSPEQQLDPSRPGIRNQRNLYDYRNGKVQLVATLDPGTEINRLQISPDGKFAAMLTKSRLTSYDNLGFREMYTYEAETGKIECASCDPSGEPPTSSARASEGGRFMSDDGRTFFTTSDALVPRDRDGKISDVYEYVEGHPQLITSGLGSRDYTGGSTVISLFSKPQFTGLEAVSHNGTDVFFSTYETLVPRDKNGEFVKFYDARTNGGFDESPGLAPCEAADECHGAGSSAPTAATVASGANAPGGNVVTEKQKKPKHKAKHKKKRHKKHKKSGRKAAHHG